jgi:SagB-type dehydrogenase family enzyme
MKLSEPELQGQVSLEEALSRRRSIRDFASKSLTWEQISQLLWSAQGITDNKYKLRTAPSAGALFPLVIYLVSEAGVFLYKSENNILEKIIESDIRHNLCRAALGQDSIEQAPVNIVICAVYKKIEANYGQRAVRYVHIEVGHAAQNVHLKAVAMGLDSVPIGAFHDEQVKQMLSLPHDCYPLYIIPIGYSQE